MARAARNRYDCAMRIPILAAALALPLAAQDPQPQTPPAPLLRIDTVGPAGWRMRFAPTNLGSLLESAAGRKVWQPALAPFERHWRALAGVGDSEFAAARKRVLDHAGAVQLSVWIEPTAGGGRQPAVYAGCIVAGDGDTDLDALARDLRTLLARLEPGAEFTPQTIDERQVAVLRNAREQLTAPQRDGDRLLIAYASGGELGTALQRARGSTADPPAPTTPALKLSIDLVQAIALARPEWDADDARGAREIGLDSLGTFVFTLGTAGPHVLAELALAFRAGERGVFGAFFPERAGLPRLLVIAKDETTWKAGQLDLAVLMRALISAVSAWSRNEPGEIRSQAKENLGIDLETDLFAHANGEVLLLGPPLGDGQQGVQPFVFEMFDNDDADSGPPLAFVLGLADEARFRAGFLAMLDRQAFVRQRDSSIHDGIEIRRCSVSFFGSMYVAIGRGLFLWARGPNASARIAALLDAAKKVPDAKPTRAGDFAILQRFAPEGLNGASVISLPAAFAHAFVFDMLGEILPDVPDGLLPWRADAEGTPSLEEVLPLLRQHHLDRARTLTGHAAGRWTWRLFW
jgi:hypothetical protein